MDKEKIENVLKMLDEPDKYDKEDFVLIVGQLVLEIQDQKETIKLMGEETKNNELSFTLLSSQHETVLRKFKVQAAELEVIKKMRE
tara:strand:+ start:628 stop:885 length:258 start_codon:yes stop_codon:yes gene_type:complete